MVLIKDKAFKGHEEENVLVHGLVYNHRCKWKTKFSLDLISDPGPDPRVARPKAHTGCEAPLAPNLIPPLPSTSKRILSIFDLLESFPIF